MVLVEAKRSAPSEGARVLRVHFTAEDILRTRFAPGPAPLMELGLALTTLQRRDLAFQTWPRQAWTRLPGPARPLLDLVPRTGAGAQFIDPISDGMEDGLEAVKAMPQTFVRRELRRLVGIGQPITPWLRGLDERDPAAWQRLAGALRSGHDALVARAWPKVLRSYRGELAWQGRLMAEKGLHAVLDGLHPSTRMRDLTLEVDHPKDFTLHLDGRGVTLLPSPFWTGRPMIGLPLDGSVLIVYSALTPVPLVDDQAGAEPLAELLGRTRAAVLALAAAPCSTGELARELGISPATASEHARTLRNAGLLVTERAGKAVRHSVTPLGAQLLGMGARVAQQPEVTTGDATTAR
jgi:DNA-binding transcriptional ArsR family regulator